MSTVLSEDTEVRALSYIVRRHAEQGYPPTVREIGEAVGFSSPSSGMAIVRSLVKRGWVTMVPRTPRTIMVTEQGKERAS